MSLERKPSNVIHESGTSFINFLACIGVLLQYYPSQKLANEEKESTLIIGERSNEKSIPPSSLRERIVGRKFSQLGKSWEMHSADPFRLTRCDNQRGCDPSSKNTRSQHNPIVKVHSSVRDRNLASTFPGSCASSTTCECGKIDNFSVQTLNWNCLGVF